MTLSARTLLHSLVGRQITTVRGRTNVVLAIAGEDVIVGTERSPAGAPIPIKWVEDALARLLSEGEVEVSVEELGYRSAFVGAVLLQVPSTTLVSSSPPRIRLAASEGAGPRAS